MILKENSIIKNNIYMYKTGSFKEKSKIFNLKTLI